MSEEKFSHKGCTNYIPQIDGCILYFELGAKDVSQYDCCYEDLIYGVEDE